MAISDTIQSMYDNVGEVYDTITNVTLPSHKNIENIPSTIRESYLEIMNNGIDVIWENWEKVLGQGTSLTLSNTVEAPMKIEYVGNTSQETTTGKNLININASYIKRENASYSNINISNNTLSYSITGTRAGYVGYVIPTTIGNTYTLSFSLTKGSIFTIELDSVIADIDGNFGLGRTSPYTYTATKQYLGVWLSASSITDNQASVSNLMLEQNNQATSFEPYTNGASPNPDYPQEVHVVSGDNTVEVVGKNLANIYNLENISVPAYKLSIADDKITIKDNTSQNGYAETGKSLSTLCPNLKVGDSVTLTFNTTSSVANKDKIYLATPASQTWNNNSAKTITQNMLDAKVVLYGGTNETAIISNFMISTTGGDYKPYQSATYPINLPEGMFLGSIGDYQDRFFKTSGKNLFDKSVGFTNAYISSTGTIENANTNALFNGYIEVEPNTYYTYSCNSNVHNIAISEFNEGKSFITRTFNNSNKSLTITTGNTTKFVRLQLNYNNSSTVTQTIIDNLEFMFQKGSTALPYEPYGTGWYLEKKIGKVVLNENSDIVYYQAEALTNVYRFRYPIDTMETITTSTSPFKCNIYGSNDVYYNYNYDSQSTYLAGGIWYIKINKSLIDSFTGTTLQEKFQSYLSQNNIILYDKLLTPTYTKIEGTLKEQLEEIKKSKNGQTNISQTNNDLPFVLDVSALKE